MSGPRGIKASVRFARRTKARRGGNVAVRQDFDRQAPDSLAVWRDTCLESLGARNYSEETRDGRRGALDHFLAWAAERDMTKAGELGSGLLAEDRPLIQASAEIFCLYDPEEKRR